MSSDVYPNSGYPQDSPKEVEPVTVVVTIKEHLARLEAQETKKPPNKRRTVPSMAELAAAAGITRQGMYQIAGNRVRKLDLDTLSAVLNMLRYNEFPAEVSDLLTAHPVSDVAQEESGG